MKSTSNIGRTLHVMLLALCGLSFYALMLTLLFLIVGLVMSARVQAKEPFDSARNVSGQKQDEIAATAPLRVNIRVASLPQQITLCRDLGGDAIAELLFDEDGEYEWAAYIDADGNPATSNPSYDADALLLIYSTDPQDPLYFWHDCAPHAVDTAKALRAELVDLRPGARGDYPFTRTRVPLEVDFAKNTLRVALDRNLPELAGLSPTSRFNFSAAGIYQGPCVPYDPRCHGQAYAVDLVDPLLLGAGPQVVANDPGNDLAGCVPTDRHPDTSWCQPLDIVSIEFAGQANAAAAPPAMNIDASFTGSWFDPAQSGHGLMLEVLSEHRLLAMWFAFSPQGDEQSWFGGVGTYSGATATIIDVAQPSGGRWIPNFDPNSIVRSPWGTLTFTFTDCDHGRVDFSSGLGYGSGSMNLLRLTQPAGLTCP
ncbi:MAG TPA: hypothetical protein VHQ21_14045 [Rhodanobacteraceae bacterium]|nr:hypothetical protein [Rhodanobacteraceae bacterium]